MLSYRNETFTGSLSKTMDDGTGNQVELSNDLMVGTKSLSAGFSLMVAFSGWTGFMELKPLLLWKSEQDQRLASTSTSPTYSTSDIDREFDAEVSDMHSNQRYPGAISMGFSF
ncbi:MAG: hypothetical protein RRB13_08520 [bacterium]|nr:hypothetical protein [bacterium]